MAEAFVRRPSSLVSTDRCRRRGSRATDLRSVFSRSYAPVSRAAKVLFRRIGLHPGTDFGADAAAGVTGRPVPRVRPLITELVRAHLLTEPG